METITLLKTLCAAPGVSGGEDAVLTAAEEILKALGPCHRTVHNALVCRVMDGGEGAPHLLLDAHIDEIGLTVTHIDDNGFLRVAQCGGVDRRSVMAARVIVHTAAGDLPGIVGSVPPHLDEGERKNPKIEDIWIDIGLTGEQAKKAVQLGDKISFCGEVTELLGGNVSGKAQDDRCCCAAVIKAAEEIQRRWQEENLPPLTLTVLLSSQEETGGLGALTAAYALAPTEAVAVDVTHGATPDIADRHCAEIGKGPVVDIGATLSRRMAKDFKKAGAENGIPYQVKAMGGGRTGTNADSIVKVGAGIETMCISVPLRYMHTAIEVVSLEDIDNTARLMAAYAVAVHGKKEG